LRLLELSAPQAAVGQYILFALGEQAIILWLSQRKPQFVKESVFHHSIDI
jgi:hypothetical protein